MHVSTSHSGATQVVAVDLGGTTVRAALVEEDGTVVARLREPLRRGEAPDQVTNLMNSIAAAGQARTAVVGVPGRVDHDAGIVHIARNLPATDLDGLSAERLGYETGLDVQIAGDVELAAIGEAYFGAGSREGTTAYLTLSTGVGAAAVSDGRLLAGRIAGFQAGFLHLLGPHRPMIDVLGSGQRMRLLADEIGHEVDFTTARELAEANGPESSAAREAITDIVDAATAMAVLLCHVCSADRVVVGGGLTRAGGSWLIDQIADRIADSPVSHVSWDVNVRAAERGDDSALVGAAAWGAARPTTPVGSSSPLMKGHLS